MLLQSFFCVSILVVLTEGSGSFEKEDVQIRGVRENLDQVAKTAVLKLKTTISKRIDSHVDKGLSKLEFLDRTCIELGRNQLEQIRTRFQKELNECSHVIPATYEDAKDIITVGGYEAMWIAGTVWDMVGGFGPCLELDRSNQTLVQCLFDATTNVVDLIGDDAILSTKYILAVGGFVFKTVIRVWSCIDQELLVSSIDSVLTSAQKCHNIVNSFR